MTSQEFNALPEEARRFIEAHAGCLSCGNPESKLTRAYELYKANKMANVYVLFGGGINYAFDGNKGVLYNINSEDTPDEIRAKLDIAARIKEVRSEAFISYDERGIEDLLESLPAEEIINLLTDEEKAAQAAWTERSTLIGIDTLTADYEALKAFATEKGLAPVSQKKIDLIDAIDAVVTDDLN